MIIQLRKPILKIFSTAYGSHASGFSFSRVIVKNFEKAKIARKVNCYFPSFLFIAGVFCLKVFFIMKLKNNF